ncbi:hypothetical protein GE061_019174 [Apolygus lucorum]|uniref:Uncharacterized protein n=1 Tax=Apolygus lucorum TaxID=248454 RepID=A0A6A4JJK3_APOLU|nr:hypothetical protein GE061_019174 [Apolygus lucorum]
MTVRGRKRVENSPLFVENHPYFHFCSPRHPSNRGWFPPRGVGRDRQPLPKEKCPTKGGIGRREGLRPAAAVDHSAPPRTLHLPKNTIVNTISINTIGEMPRPWSLPTMEEADELYRRIDQLITDLYHLIRSVLFGPPPLPPQQEPPDAEEDIAVPDLLAELGAQALATTDSDSIVDNISPCCRRPSAAEVAGKRLLRPPSIILRFRLDFLCKFLFKAKIDRFSAICKLQFHMMISLVVRT